MVVNPTVAAATKHGKPLIDPLRSKKTEFLAFHQLAMQSLYRVHPSFVDHFEEKMVWPEKASMLSASVVPFANQDSQWRIFFGVVRVGKLFEKVFRHKFPTPIIHMVYIRMDWYVLHVIFIYVYTIFI